MVRDNTELHAEGMRTFRDKRILRFLCVSRVACLRKRIYARNRVAISAIEARICSRGREAALGFGRKYSRGNEKARAGKTYRRARSTVKGNNTYVVALFLSPDGDAGACAIGCINVAHGGCIRGDIGGSSRGFSPRLVAKPRES